MFVDIDRKPEQIRDFVPQLGNQLAGFIDHGLKPILGTAAETDNLALVVTNAEGLRFLGVTDTELIDEIDKQVDAIRIRAEFDQILTLRRELLAGRVPVIVTSKKGSDVEFTNITHQPEFEEVLDGVGEQTQQPSQGIISSQLLDKPVQDYLTQSLVKEIEPLVDDIAKIVEDFRASKNSHIGLEIGVVAAKAFRMKRLAQDLEKELEFNRTVDRQREKLRHMRNSGEDRIKIDRKTRALNDIISKLLAHPSEYLAGRYVDSVAADTKSQAQKSILLAIAEKNAQIIAANNNCQPSPQRPTIEISQGRGIVAMVTLSPEGDPDPNGSRISGLVAQETKKEVLLEDIGPHKYNLPWLSADSPIELPTTMLTVNGNKIYIIKALTKKQESISARARQKTGDVTTITGQIENYYDAKITYIAKCVAENDLRHNRPTNFKPPLEDTETKYGKYPIWGYRGVGRNPARIYFTYCEAGKVARSDQTDINPESQILIILGESDKQEQLALLLTLENISQGNARDLRRRGRKRG